MQIQPYLFFAGRCEEAIAFYRQAVNAQVLMLMRFKDSPVPHDPGTGGPVPDGEKIMHATIRIGETTINLSDGQAGDHLDFRGFALSLTTGGEGEARQVFNALAAGGLVLMPLGQTFFSPAFGMLTDRFGVMWMVYVVAQQDRPASAQG